MSPQEILLKVVLIRNGNRMVHNKDMVMCQRDGFCHEE